jgi:TonB family protein
MVVEQVEQRVRRERRVWRIGLLSSLLFHLLLLVFFQTRAERLSPYAAAGPAAGDPVAAPGGGGMRAIVLQPPVPIEIPPRPESFIIEPVQVNPPVEEMVLALNEVELRDPGEGNREGPESGPGLPGAEGGGDAGNAMSGLRRLIPPVPRGVIMAPLSRPSSVRGREVTVWVFINQAGAVDSVRLEPPTPDSKYNEDLMREARDWVFEPAERAGRAVATWFSYTWKL